MDTSRFRAILLLALVFAAGALVGVAVDRLDLFAGTPEAAPVDSASEGRGRDEERERRTTIEQFADELGLTAGQRSEIETFLDHYREGARSLRAAVQPQYRALMDSVRIQIESVLTEEQVEDYRGLLRRRYDGGRTRERDGDGDGERGASGDSRQDY